jgi:hypothetical protein
MESSPFKGGVRAPALNNPHPIIAYVWQKQLIAVDLGDRGDIQAARWQLEVWTEKISSELGYSIVFVGLVHPDAKGFVGEMLNDLAKRTDLDPIWQKEKDWMP